MVTYSSLSFSFSSTGQVNIDTEVASPVAASFDVRVTSTTSSQVNQVDARYVILTDNYTSDNVNLIISFITLTSVTISSGSPFTQSITVNTFNNNGSAINTFVSISAIDSPSGSAAPNGVDLVTSLAASGQTFTFSVTSNQATSRTFNSIKLLYVIYNAGKFNDPTFATWVSGVLSGSATSTGTRRLLQGPIAMTHSSISPKTATVALNGFNNAAQVQYTTTINNGNWHAASNVAGNSLTFSYLFMQTYACSVDTPYAFTNNTCVAACPVGYYPNDATLTCDACATGCYNCTSGTVCVECDSGYYLQQNNVCSTSCPSGYFSNNSTKTCDSCPTNCAVCGTTTACTTCFSFYFLNSSTNLCESCQANCQTCSDSSTCSQCQTDYSLENNVCVQNSSSILAPVLAGTLGGLLFLIILIILIVLCLREKEKKTDEGKYVESDVDKSGK